MLRRVRTQKGCPEVVNGRSESGYHSDQREEEDKLLGFEVFPSELLLAFQQRARPM